MRCGETSELLYKMLMAGGEESISLHSSDRALLRDMERRGLVRRVTASPADESGIISAREGLAELQGQEREKLLLLYRHPAARITRLEVERELRDLDRREEVLRSRILRLSEEASAFQGSVDIDGVRYAVTYGGRELYSKLSMRLPRVADWDVDDFGRELGRLVEAFDARAAKAKGILGEISPRMPGLDEIYLRSAAVGLSIRNEPSGTIADCFMYSVNALQKEMKDFGMANVPLDRCVSIADHICTGAESLTRQAAKSMAHTFAVTWWNITKEGSVPVMEAARCALMLQSYGRSGWREMLERAREISSRMQMERRAPEIDLAAAVLLTGSSGSEDETVERFLEYHRSLSTSQKPGEADFASAILAVAGEDETQQVLGRFRTAKDYLTRFTENGMTDPAAMLAVMSQSIEEVLDTLRIASAKITQYKLSLGGMENLSLGVKIVLGTALLPIISKAPPPPLPPCRLLPEVACSRPQDWSGSRSRRPCSFPPSCLSMIRASTAWR